MENGLKKLKLIKVAGQGSLFALPEGLMKTVSIDNYYSLSKNARIITFTLFIFLVLTSISWATDYYVDIVKGDDSYSGTFDTPWKTINKANRALQPGDTVFIRQGTYKETIRPSISGNTGAHITYTNYENENVTITGVYDGVDLVDKSYIIIDGIKIIDVDHYWVNMRGTRSTTKNIIKNCYMETARGWAGIYTRYASHIKVQNNTCVGTCPCSSDCDKGGPADVLHFDASDHVLVENNDLSGGTHVCLSFRTDNGPSDHNIIANNTITNPLHTTLELYGDVDYTLIEGNSIIDAGDDGAINWCGSDRDRSFPREDHRSIQLASSNCKIRKNIFINNGTMPFLDFKGYTVNNNRVYNNTHYKDYKGNYMYAGTGNIVKNSIFSHNKIYGIQGRSGNEIINNNAYECDIIPNGADASNNTSLPPRFVDPSNKNFNLSSESPMIDAGAWLTTVTSEGGTGKAFTVSDASYFTDGWGIREGDDIQLEGTFSTVKIVDINDNRITVDQEIDWQKGQGVSLSFSGNAPDVGAMESGQSNSELPPPTNLRIITE